LKAKQSNSIIPVIHRLITSEHGENYWFNGSVKYVMECLGEKDYDYCFFAGLTGDVFTQHYTYTKYAGEALSSYMLEENMGGNPAKYVEDIFAKCGYAATYVSNQDLNKNTEMYLNTLIAYIEKGIPVIRLGSKEGVYVGYEDYGKVLLLITGDNNQPERIPLDEALQGWVDPKWFLQGDGGWVFAGEKKEQRPLAGIYREAVCEIPQRMSIKTDTHCFGPEAFRAWARDIENGKFDSMTGEEFDAWAYYTNYVCVLATNGSCCHEFLKRARELNPDFGFLEEISALYRRTAEMWGGDNNQNDPDSLEALSGGFNITLEALQNKEKRSRIVAKIREFANITDEILAVLKKNLHSIVSLQAKTIGYPYKKCSRSAFDIIGFTKVVHSGGELYNAIRADGRWDALHGMNPCDKTIYGVASHDDECYDGCYRYTFGISKDEHFKENPLYAETLFPFRVIESDWIVFSLDFLRDYGAFWQADPFILIDQLGFHFNNSIGMHMDVYKENFDGHEMEFWMPVIEKLQ